LEVAKQVLDSYDRSILSILAENGRISWRDLAQRIHLSLTPTIRRVQALEEAGWIRGYGARIPERRLIGGMSAFVSVSLARQTDTALEVFEASVASLAGVRECYIMTGEADYLLRVVTSGLEEFEVLVKQLAALPGISSIKSSIALRSVFAGERPLFAIESGGP
jgi:Lrp/AsnC family transcriptional regulator, leucine-responsive regulatory protein